MILLPFLAPSLVKNTQGAWQIGMYCRGISKVPYLVMSCLIKIVIPSLLQCPDMMLHIIPSHQFCVLLMGTVVRNFDQNHILYNDALGTK